MGKQIIALTIDYAIYSKFCDMVDRGSRSKVVQELIEKYISYEKSDVSKLDLTLIKNEYESVVEEQQNLAVKAQTLKEDMRKIEELKNEETIKALEEEKMRKEKETICINCGSSLGFKFHRFPKGHVCKGCFLTCNKDDVARWS